MSATPLRQPNAPNPNDTSSRVRVTYPITERLSARVMLEEEVGWAATDNGGEFCGPGDTYWFPTKSHADAFARRVARETPEVVVEMIAP